MEMLDKKYKVIFHGVASNGDVNTVKHKLATLYQGNLTKVDRFFQGKAVVVKRDLDLQAAQKLCAALSKRIDGAIFKVAVLSSPQSVPVKSEKGLSNAKFTVPATQNHKIHTQLAKKENNVNIPQYPGLSHYKDAINARHQKNLGKDHLHIIVNNLEQAITLGLPQHSFELIDSYAYLAYTYTSLYGGELEQNKAIRKKIIELFETAIALDAQNHVGYFLQTEHFGYLERLDILYVFEKNLFLQKGDTGKAIENIKHKLQSVEYVSQIVLPGIHLELGNLYIQRGEFEQAKTHWEFVLASERIMEESESLWRKEVWQKAQKNIHQMEEIQKRHNKPQESLHSKILLDHAPPKTKNDNLKQSSGGKRRKGYWFMGLLLIIIGGIIGFPSVRPLLSPAIIETIESASYHIPFYSRIIRETQFSSSEKRIVINCPVTNMREAPSGEAKKIMSIACGTPVEILGYAPSLSNPKYKWYHVRSQEGKVGWMYAGDNDTWLQESDDSVVPQMKENRQQSFPIAIVVTKRNSLSLRSGPGTRYKKIGRIKKGRTVKVLDKINEHWYKIQVRNGGVGYAAGEYLRIQDKYEERIEKFPLPPLPFEDFGACPFEGCVYREWVVKNNLPIRKEMNETAPIAFIVKTGENVTALTGVVVTIQPRIEKASRPVEISGTAIQKGDIVYFYTPLGEGVSKVWFRGKMYHHGIYELGELLQESKSTWWVKIRNSKGLTGWTNQAEQHFGKMDLYSVD